MAYDQNMPKEISTFNGRTTYGYKPVFWDENKQAADGTMGDWQVVDKAHPMPTGDNASLTELQAIKAKQAETDAKLQGIIDGTTPASTQLTGSNVEKITLQLGTTTVDSGSIIDVSGHSTIIFDVSGTFEAEIIFHYFNEAGVYRRMLVENIETGEVANTFSKPGSYRANVSGINNVYARVNEITSGSVDITATVSANPHSQTSMVKVKNSEVARTLNFLVPAGGSEMAISYKDVSRYPFQYIIIHTDAAHEFSATFRYNVTGNVTFSTAMVPPFEVMRSTGSLRASSDWIESKSAVLSVNILNHDTVDHNYDIVLFGVG